MGTGGLIVGERVDEKQLDPLIRGGTGSRSEHEVQPDFLPDMCESGTPNVVGLAGLEAGVRWVLERGVEAIRAHEVALTRKLIDGLRAIPGVTVYGTRDAELQTATVSFNINGMAPSEAGLRLDDEYRILCRVGLHCAPTAHKTLGTFPTGTVRFGLVRSTRPRRCRRHRGRAPARGRDAMTSEYAVVLVQSTSHAMRVEKLLRDAGISCKMIPVPRHISSDCGACVRIRQQDVDAVRRVVEAARIEVEAFKPSENGRR
jgi:hypothetical protein